LISSCKKLSVVQ